ncbi:MAG: hypothetical protein WD176_06440 [Pirellulales bacterium]
MTEPLLSLVIDGTSSRVFAPGETLAVDFQVDAVDPDELCALEASVLWYTEGKGDEDLGIHYFKRYTAQREGATLHELRFLRTILPASPLSYEGRIVKVRWCVRVRAFLSRNRQVTENQVFQLGRVPRPVWTVTRPEVEVVPAALEAAGFNVAP